MNFLSFHDSGRTNKIVYYSFSARAGNKARGVCPFPLATPLHRWYRYYFRP